MSDICRELLWVRFLWYIVLGRHCVYPTGVENMSKTDTLYKLRAERKRVNRIIEGVMNEQRHVFMEYAAQLYAAEPWIKHADAPVQHWSDAVPAKQKDELMRAYAEMVQRFADKNHPIGRLLQIRPYRELSNPALDALVQAHAQAQAAKAEYRTRDPQWARRHRGVINTEITRANRMVKRHPRLSAYFQDYLLTLEDALLDVEQFLSNPDKDWEQHQKLVAGSVPWYRWASKQDVMSLLQAYANAVHAMPSRTKLEITKRQKALSDRPFPELSLPEPNEEAPQTRDPKYLRDLQGPDEVVLDELPCSATAPPPLPETQDFFRTLGGDEGEAGARSTGQGASA